LFTLTRHLKAERTEIDTGRSASRRTMERGRGFGRCDASRRALPMRCDGGGYTRMVELLHARRRAQIHYCRRGHSPTRPWRKALQPATAMAPGGAAAAPAARGRTAAAPKSCHHPCAIDTPVRHATSGALAGGLLTTIRVVVQQKHVTDSVNRVKYQSLAANAQKREQIRPESAAQIDPFDKVGA
jgi:hypothetical protein